MEISNLKLSMIQVSAMNPRKTFDEEALKELASNIEKQGLLQPITVRPIEFSDSVEDGDVISFPTKYEIVCGERRFRAMSLLSKSSKGKVKTIPALVREMTDDEAFDAMITENLQRKDVDPIEEAYAFAELAKKGHTTAELAARFGKSTRFILDRIKLNDLIPELAKWVKEGNIPFNGAIMLSKLKEETQKDFFNNYEYNNPPFSFSLIKNFVENKFRFLDSVSWKKNKDYMKKCDKCESNTKNHGCLFYEMNSDTARCINSDCFEKTRIDYIIYQVKNTDNVVMKGEKLEWGKKAIIYNPGSFSYDTDRSSRYNKVIESLKELGYEIVDISSFNGRCYYGEDDSRYQEYIDEHKAYECISLCDGDITFQKCLYWIKDSNDEVASISPEEKEVKEILEKKKKVIDKCTENINADLRNFANSCKYGSRDAILSVKESVALDMIILNKCSYQYKNSLGINTNDAVQFLSYVQNNQKDRLCWYREFMRDVFSSTDAIYNSVVQKAMGAVFMEQYEKEILEISGKHVKTLDKRLEKIKEQLKELGYNEKGEKED